MKAEPKILDSEKSVVKKIYRKYDDKQDKWYSSDTPKAGYDIISYYATKVRIQLFYRTEERAQEEADKYNKRLRSYKKGKMRTLPDYIDWYTFNGTELHDEYRWGHGSGTWLYAHGWLQDYWSIEELCAEDLYATDWEGNSTKKMFDVLFKIPVFSNLKIEEIDGVNKLAEV